MREFAGVRLDSAADALADISAGRPVIVFDDEHRENEGDLIFAARHATQHLLAFTVRYTSGYICVPMAPADCDRLDLPPMRAVNQCPRGTAYTVTVDARWGVSTGISAADRALTIRLLADPSSGPGDFSRPGHVVPLRAAAGGVLQRRGHTEAASDLARLAGCGPAAVLCELVNDNGTMKRLPELRRFADQHNLKLICIAELADYRLRLGSEVGEQVAALT
jgi:3,4-dihydroxy 2-butanone 4-phosphate synthase / GTP cyclohydrolase II